MNGLKCRPSGRSLPWIMAALTAGLGFCLGGCAAVPVGRPALGLPYDPQVSFPPIEPYKVFFFPSKADLPGDYKITPVAQLKSPPDTLWDDETLFGEFLRKGGEMGANAVVLESLEKVEGKDGQVGYQGRATAYRLTRDDSPDAPNLKSAYKATREPEPPLDKSKVIYTLPGMSSP